MSSIEPVKRGDLPVLKKDTVNGTMEWEIWVVKTREGYGRMITCYGLEGGKKQTIREKITEGKNAGRKNATTPYEQACLEASARWEKQKSRKGYGVTAEESAGIRATSPMLAHVYDKHRFKVHWDSACAQPKLDGFRALAKRDGKRVIITSRENQPIAAVSHITGALANILPEGVIIDGELYRHGLSLNQISSACKARGPLTGKIQYHVYDLISPEEFAARCTDLYGILRKVDQSHVRLVETVKVRNELELMVCQKEFIGEGYEGAMLRHGLAGYEAGKSHRLLKVKTFTDDYFMITDWKLGRGKYAGVPIFTCTTKKGNLFDVLAPGDMDEKRAMGEEAAGMIGQKIKVKFQHYTKTAEPVPFLPVAVKE